MEVLKDKIKEEVIKTNGSRLDQLAKIISDANNKRWSAKMGAKKGCESFKQQIADFFCGDACKGS